MPVQKSKKPVKPAAKSAAKTAPKAAVKSNAKTAAKATVKAPVKSAAKPAKPLVKTAQRAPAKTSKTKPAVNAGKPVIQRAALAAKVEKSKKAVISNKAPVRSAASGKAPLKPLKPPKKELSVPTKTSATATKTAAKPAVKPAVKTAAKPAAKKEAELKVTPATAVTEVAAKKKPGRPPKSPAAESTAPAAGAKRGRKPKAALKGDGEEDMSDIEDDLVGEPVVETTEKVKPLRMKISKAKERALMKEFGLEETVLSEEDMAKRRLRLKTLIKLGKTRGYLTHGEISDHLPDKLVDAETLEVVVNMLNDMDIAVYEQAPDAETLLINNTGATVATEEEAEEQAEAALSTVDSEFGRTTDPVRMYMREMGTIGRAHV